MRINEEKKNDCCFIREMSSMDVAKLLVLASEAMRCIDPTKSKHLVQKAIHANPLCREAWAAKQLLCA